MKSLYRLRRLAIANKLATRPASCPVVRCVSTSTPRTASAKVDATFDLSGLRRLDKELSKREAAGNQPKWSDDGTRTDGDTPGPFASTSTSGFFTASRPVSPSVPPPSLSEQQALETLMPLLTLPRDKRDEALCARIWRTYHHLSPSTRRSLNPTILRMVLRAVIPSPAGQAEFKRRAKDPIRAFASQAAKLERRLQIIVADMIRSTWLNKDDRQVVPVPSSSDYHYAMSALSHLGATEACEAIYRELKDTEQTASGRAACLHFRLRALKVWMTERIHYSTFTHKRPELAQRAPIARSLRWRSDKQDSDPASYAVRVLWDVLREVGSSATQINRAVYSETVVTLRRILQFLPDTEVAVSTTLRKMLQQVLEKGYGIDFRFLRQDPAFTSTPIGPNILDATMYLMGSQGDVWRMAAMYESLSTTALSASAALKESVNGVDEDDVGETLSAALAAEEAASRSMDWLGRAREARTDFDTSSRALVSESGTEASIAAGATMRAETGVEASTSTLPIRDLPPHLQTGKVSDPTEQRVFDDFSPPPVPSPASLIRIVTASDSDPRGHDDPAALSADVSSARTDTISTMLDLVRKHGNVDLAMHLLRTSLREAASSRNDWLSCLVRSEAQEFDVHRDWTTSRAMLVSGKWFESVHLLARGSSGSSWVLAALRDLMEAEAQSIREEYHILTGMDMDDRTPVPPTALIHRFSPDADGSEVSKTKRRVFNPDRHLAQLKRTHAEVVKLLSVSVRQVERRRQVTAIKNARRAERAAIAAREEAERVEAKKAGRKKREESVESTLVLA